MFKNKLKKQISLLLAVVLVVATASIGMIAYGATIVCTINSINFPDANFRAVVSDWYDENGDGYLSTDEVSGVYTMGISGMLSDTCGDNAQIKDLTGIEYFTDCKRLRISSLGLEKLDVSELTNLIELTVQGNELTELDLSSNVNLEILNCSGNRLTFLDISYNGVLSKVHAYANSITGIDFCTNAALTLKDLRVDQNELTELDVSYLSELTKLNCSHNHLRALDLSRNTKLMELTEAFLGSQTLSATARYGGNKITVEFDIPNWQTNLASTSVDTTEIISDEEVVTTLGYDGTYFNPKEVDDIVNGITYYYNTGLATAESMEVHLDINRDFWQVKFFTDESKATLYSKCIVFTGDNAFEPTDIEIPQCKKFMGWSDEFRNVSEDKEIYATWADDHDMQILGYENGLVYFNCTKCLEQGNELSFEYYVNMRQDNEYFQPLLDMNKDNIINAKDYAYILKAIKSLQ